MQDQGHQGSFRAPGHVAKRFPFMRAFDCDLIFMCANIRTDSGVTTDLKTVARDLAELGDMAAAFANADGGCMLKIGYEGLSWATRNNTLCLGAINAPVTDNISETI